MLNFLTRGIKCSYWIEIGVFICKFQMVCRNLWYWVEYSEHDPNTVNDCILDSSHRWFTCEIFQTQKNDIFHGRI